MADYRYYLGPWSWQSECAPYCWCPPAGCTAGLDLATISQLAVNGGSDRSLGLFWTADTLGSAYTLLGKGDCRELAVTGSMQDAWESLTGYRPQGDKLVDLIWDHLTEGADPDGEETAKPLVPTSSRQLELVLPGHSVVRHEKFNFGHKHANKLLTLLHRDLTAIRNDSTAGKCHTKNGKDVEFHRRYLKSLLEKYRLRADEWRVLTPRGWDKGETPLGHGTTYTENFNGADKAGLGYQLTWSDYGSGYWSNNTNQAKNVGTGAIGSAASNNSALGSSDNYARCDITSCTDGSANYQVGASARVAAYSASSRYLFRLVRYYNPDRQELAKWDGGGSFTSLGSNNEDTSPTVSIECRCNGSTITGYIGGVQKKQATDTTYSSGVYGGLFGYNTVYADNFQMSDELSVSGQPIVKRFGGVPGMALNRGVW